MAALGEGASIVLPDDSSFGFEVQVDYPGYRSTRLRSPARPLSVPLPAERGVAVLVHRPDLRPAVGRRCRELDVPIRRVDDLARSRCRVVRREVEMLAPCVGHAERAAIREPAGRHIGDVAVVCSELTHRA